VVVRCIAGNQSKVSTQSFRSLIAMKRPRPTRFNNSGSGDRPEPECVIHLEADIFAVKYLLFSIARVR
jgi:hypothetical protein